MPSRDPGRHLDRDIDRARPDPRDPDAVAARIASRQHGVVTRTQLLAESVTPNRIDRLIQRGRLHPIHRGVYLLGALVGGLEPPLARVMAAALASGPSALVSHRSAAEIWGILDSSGSAPVDVTVIAADRGRRPGIRPHRLAELAAADRASVEGVPVTSPTRTLIDLAAHVPLRTLEQALARAERLGLSDRDTVAHRLVTAPRRPGIRRLRTLVAGGTPAFTRSAAEERFLALVRDAGLPEPETNVRLVGHEVDFLWRRAALVVEVDGFAHHATRRSFETDRERDARLLAAGVRVLRVTWRQITREPAKVLVRLSAALATSPSRPHSLRRPRAGVG